MKYHDIKLLARKFRHEPTKWEERLWQYIRRKQINGKQFYRQRPIIYETIGNEHFFFVPDFYCASQKLAVELDGQIHEETKERDQHRDAILNAMGITVLRFRNKELDDIQSVLNIIKSHLD